MEEIYAIIVACGIWKGEPDCIRLQLRGPPIKEYQCPGAILDLRRDFEIMRVKVPGFRDYVIVEHICSKESLPHGRKPKEENT